MSSQLLQTTPAAARPVTFARTQRELVRLSLVLVPERADRNDWWC